MLEALIRFSLRNRVVLVVLTVVLAAGGVLAFLRLPIDAVPDITNVQVQVLTNAPALGPLDVERFVTIPVELGMSGIPRLTETRSISRAGLSAVTLVFEDGTDIYWARQQVQERLGEVREGIPKGFGEPAMGPVSSGLGEIYQFEVRGQGYTPMELRTLLDWEVAYRLRSVPGVVEVNSFGGELKSFQVQVDPELLRSFGLGLDDVFRALDRSNLNAGGAYIERAGEAQTIRGDGLLAGVEDLGRVVLGATAEGKPIYLAEIGTVALAPMPRYGAVTRDGRGEAVLGIVMMLMGENSRDVSARVRQRLAEIAASLPPGVTLDTYYDRTDLVYRTVATVRQNLLEGGLLVVAVLLLLLGNLRAGLLAASIIPLSMLVAFIAMVWGGVSGNLMSLGALDFGIIVDGAVIMLENIQRRLDEPGAVRMPRFEVVREAASEVSRSILFAVLIVVMVFIPVFSLQGVEGKMFQPMAFTFVFALLGSLVLTLTLVPALAYMLLRREARAEHGEVEPGVVRWLKKGYRPLLEGAVARPALTAGLAVVVFTASALMASRMGVEFIPRLDEGSLAVQAWRMPSVGLEESVRSTTQVEHVLRSFPEVVTVVSKTGRPEIATDPAGFEVSDILVTLKPPGEWTSASSREGLLEKMDAALRNAVPGNVFSYTQPIELRFSELITGTRSDVAVKIFGDDLATLRSQGELVARAVSSVPGAADVKVEQVAGASVLRVRVEQARLARYGLNAADVLEAVSALGGVTVGDIVEGQRRFALTVRISEDHRRDPEAIARIPIATPRGQLIPLGQLVSITDEEAPNQVSRESNRRRIVVEANVRGRDLGGFVAEARRAVNRQVALPEGYYAEWGGQFENLDRAVRRLALVVPMAFALIFFLLYLALGAVRPAVLIFLNVPVAASGGVLILALRGMPLSISAGIGFIALSGVAVMNGLVLLSYLRQVIAGGRPLETAVVEGSLDRMRAMIMAPLVAALGFVPMALSRGAGAEVQQPLATVVIGGLLTSTLLTLFVLPALYRWFHQEPAENDIDL